MSFVQLVTFDDLRSVGLKVSGACKLKACIKPGGEVYNQLFLSRRVVPTLAELPKHICSIYGQILCLRQVPTQPFLGHNILHTRLRVQVGDGHIKKKLMIATRVAR